MQWDTHEASKCWCSSTTIESLCQFCKSVFFVVSLLEASPVHETLWDTKRGSPKVWKSDISCLWLSYKWQENISFSMLGKWQLSLSSFSSRTFLDWKYDILEETQISSKKVLKIFSIEKWYLGCLHLEIHCIVWKFVKTGS